jgi:type II secretory pathway component GspD/PulD (secretin)
MNVSVGRAFFDLGASVGTFDESVRISKNEVEANVVLKFGQSLILSGLREKQTSEVKDGVPILRDLPLVQYLFSNEQTSDYHKSIITILTPRPVTPGIYITAAPSNATAPRNEEAFNTPYLEELRRSSTTLLTADDNIKQIMHHLGKHRSFREFRETDLFDSTWYGSTGDLKQILKKTISFLYY